PVPASASSVPPRSIMPATAPAICRCPSCGSKPFSVVASGPESEKISEMPVPRFASISKTIQFTTAAAIVFALVASLRFLSLTGFPDDHYVHLAGAQQMLHGEWPSRDFVDLGAPLTYAISAAAQRIFGERQLTEGLLMACAFGLGAVLTLRAGMVLTGSVILGVAAALLELLVYPRTYSYPKMVLYAAAALAFVWYAARPSVARIVGLAALAACAALVRHDHGLYIGIASVVAVALSPIPSDRYKGLLSVAILAAAVFV